MRCCPRCYKPVPFESGGCGLEAHCGYCQEPLLGDRTSFAWVILAGGVIFSPLVLGAMDRPFAGALAWVLSVSCVAVVVLCLFFGWRAGGYVSPRRAGWPPERREVSRLFMKLLERSEVSYPKLSERERFLWDVCRFAACFENRGLCGGLEEFFWNEPGDHALATVDAIEKIGAKYTAAFMRQACLFFPDGGLSCDRKIRREQMERMPEQYDQMMEWAYNHPEYQETSPRLFFGIGDNLFAHLLKYWNDHPS